MDPKEKKEESAEPVFTTTYEFHPPTQTDQSSSFENNQTPLQQSLGEYHKYFVRLDSSSVVRQVILEEIAKGKRLENMVFTHCVVQNCFNKSTMLKFVAPDTETENPISVREVNEPANNFRFIPFPSNPALRSAWCQLVDTNAVAENARLCSAHFNGSDATRTFLATEGDPYASLVAYCPCSKLSITPAKIRKIFSQTPKDVLNQESPIVQQDELETTRSDFNFVNVAHSAQAGISVNEITADVTGETSGDVTLYQTSESAMADPSIATFPQPIKVEPSASAATPSGISKFIYDDEDPDTIIWREEWARKEAARLDGAILSLREHVERQNARRIPMPVVDRCKPNETVFRFTNPTLLQSVVKQEPETQSYPQPVCSQPPGPGPIAIQFSSPQSFQVQGTMQDGAPAAKKQAMGHNPAAPLLADVVKSADPGGVQQLSTESTTAQGISAAMFFS